MRFNPNAGVVTGGTAAFTLVLLLGFPAFLDTTLHDFWTHEAVVRYCHFFCYRVQETGVVSTLGRGVEDFAVFHCPNSDDLEVICFDVNLRHAMRTGVKRLSRHS